jgi:hypothetical protein
MKDKNIELMMANSNSDINISCTQRLQWESCDFHVYSMKIFGPDLYYT